MTLSEWYNSGKKVKIGKHDLFYKRAGQDQVLVCIHGFPTSSWDFELIWKELTGRFDVITSDLIGLGRSAKPKSPITIGLQADMIEGLLTELGIQSAHILAHDLGDTVAQELLARQVEGKAKQKWLSCVFLNGGIFPETHQPLLIQKLLISPLGGLIAKLTSERTFRKNMTRIFSQEHPPSEEFLKGSWKLLIENAGKSMIPRLIRYMAERREYRARWVGPLEQKLVPMRMINGAQDPISGRHAAQRYQEVVKDADVVLLENAGHYPHVETPQAVLDAFMDFHDAL